MNTCSGGSRISRRGGRGPRRGDRGPPRWLCFENFACQNERIWTHRGARPPPRSADDMLYYFISKLTYHNSKIVNTLSDSGLNGNDLK